MITSAARLVARREELALIDAAFRDSEAGEARFVLLGGDAGVGKTRIMDHVAQRLADSGVRVLRGSCVALGAEGLPLAPVTAILRSLVRDLGTDALDAIVPGASLLHRLLPDSGTAAEPSGQARMFESFTTLLERIGADRPLLLVIDDLHWADRSSRDLLGLLARSLRGTRVLVLLAFRTDTLGARHPLRAFTAELERLPSVRRVDVAPFNRAETAGLLAALTGKRPPEALVDRVYQASGGNALFAAELARTSGTRLPTTLRDLLLERFSELADGAREVVRVAAAGGPRVAHDLLAEVAGVAAPDLLAALRVAADAQILVADGDGYVFRHSLLYEAVAADLLPAERVALHRAYAAALERDPGLTSPGRAAAETAYHWSEAGDAGRALPALLRAADAAEAMDARAEQAQTLIRALGLWPRTGAPDRFAVVENALAAAGWSGEPLRALGLADRELVEETDPGRAALLHAHRGLSLYSLGRDGSVTAFDEALQTIAGDEVAPAARAKVLDLAAAGLMLRGLPDRAHAAATEAMHIASGLGDRDLLANASATAGTVLSQLGRYEEALAALEATGRPGSAPQQVRIDLNRSEALAALGRHDDAIAAARRGMHVCRTAGLTRTLGALLAFRIAAVLTVTGRWDDATAEIAAALEQDPPGGAGGMLHALHGEIALARGDLDLARERLTLAQSLTGPASGFEAVPADRLEARVALCDGRVTDARAALARALAAPVLTPAQSWALLVDGARIEARAGSRGATHLPPNEGVPLPLAERAGQLPANGALCTAYAAEYAAVSGGSWTAAVAAWDTAGDPFAASGARLRAAEAAAASGDRDGARDLLRTAAAQASALGARPLAEEIALLARAAHIDLATGPASDASPAERLGLTGREREVLRLIAEGHSNRQIAETLFISPKTASVHVSRILAKLGAATRGEAAATAHRLRLFADR
ncbi:helix-turn-helix transcriptional regulator [Actinomadura verrucosospora]|uniref:LuxR family transcriptional regulator n=1 Tax=Actinomadura verrucosospora TaxID=46165 RepID=A0A7D3ZLI5_ACTVE|nr:helix-turn-helix transcriptional regulator [Actinomadura verrucosospora]QKG27217.1 LuxR family transcriptional regulator [Actinomadura verrucosospora]